MKPDFSKLSEEVNQENVKVVDQQQQKTPEQIAAEQQQQKTPEQITAEKQSQETPEQKTERENQERIAAENKEFEGKKPEEIAAIKLARQEESDKKLFEGKTPEQVTAIKEAREIDNKYKESVNEIKPDDVFKAQQQEVVDLGKEIDYVKLGKFHGFEVKENSEKSYKESYDKYFLESKQQIDFSKFDGPAKEVVEFLSKGGHVADFIDPLKNINTYLVMNDEDLIRSEFKAEKIDDDEIETKIDKLIEDGTLETKAEEIRTDLKKVRNDTIQKTIKARTEQLSKLKENEKSITVAENEQLKQAVDKIENFIGIPVSKEIRESIKKEVETEDFHKKLNSAEAQTDAYFFMKYKNNIISYYENQIKIERRAGYNDGIKRAQSGLFNNIPDLSQSPGHNKQQPGGFKDLKNEVEN